MKSEENNDFGYVYSNGQWKEKWKVFRSKNQLDGPLERKILMTFQNANTEVINNNNT